MHTNNEKLLSLWEGGGLERSEALEARSSGSGPPDLEDPNPTLEQAARFHWEAGQKHAFPQKSQAHRKSIRGPGKSTGTSGRPHSQAWKLRRRPRRVASFKESNEAETRGSQSLLFRWLLLRPPPDRNHEIVALNGRRTPARRPQKQKTSQCE